MIQTCNLKTTKIEKENHLNQTSMTLGSILIYVNFPGYGILTHPFYSISSLCRTVFSPKVRLGGRFGKVKTSSKHAVLAMNKHQGRTNETKMDTKKNENQNIHHKRRKHHEKHHWPWRIYYMYPAKSYIHQWQQKQNILTTLVLGPLPWRQRKCRNGSQPQIHQECWWKNGCLPL